jgi:hypothetical protein
MFDFRCALAEKHVNSNDNVINSFPDDVVL